MARAGIKIASASTDAEAEAAWQSLGSNTTGTALAVMGAKSIAKGAGVDTTGVRGTARAVKHVFTESGSAIKNSATGIYNAAKSGYGIRGKFDAVKSEVSTQAGDFATTVKGNYNNAVYGTKTKIDDDAVALDKKSNDLQSKINETKNPIKKSALERQKATIDAKKAALDEIKGKNAWDDVNSVIENNKAQIATKKSELASATTKADKAKIQA
ncbi:hypothetical protein IKJ53_07240, partial [bacterium]|nr:hypothetical protein [bacterium]